MPFLPTMPTNRAIPAVAVGLLIPLAALAQAPAPGDAAKPAPAAGAMTPGAFAFQPGADAAKKEEKKDVKPPAAEEAIDKAIERIRKAKSFSAEIAQSVDMLGQKFEVKGTFLKSGEDRVYLKLAVSGLGDATATTLQACDGTTLWDYRQVLDTQTYRKFSIGPIFKKLDNPVLDATIRDQVHTELGFAGPDALLSGLRQKVTFNQKAEETLDGKKVWVVRGEWKDRSGLVGPNQQPLPATIPLPPYMPANVAIWIGQDDGFPYKVEMYGNLPSMLAADNRRTGPDNRPLGGAKPPASKVEPTRIVLRYTDVKVNVPLKPELFGWQPPADARGVQDLTEPYLTRLDQAIQYKTAEKKAEAARSTEPTLDGALDAKANPEAAPK
jgi:outer membrane lipoprotein-sorting protein